ncbi:hypothetical protein [Streptomyces sp. NPDC002644]
MALTTAGLDAGRVHVPGAAYAEPVLELQLFEDGGLRLLMTRLSDAAPTPYSPPGQPEQVIFDSAAVILTRHVLHLLALLADEVGYHGGWILAAGATRLRGRRRHVPRGFPTDNRYTDDTYEEATAVTLAELQQASGAVTRRLLGPLLRSLDSEKIFAKALSDNVT